MEIYLCLIIPQILDLDFKNYRIILNTQIWNLVGPNWDLSLEKIMFQNTQGDLLLLVSPLPWDEKLKQILSHYTESIFFSYYVPVVARSRLKLFHQYPISIRHFWEKSPRAQVWVISDHVREENFVVVFQFLKLLPGEFQLVFFRVRRPNIFAMRAMFNTLFSMLLCHHHFLILRPFTHLLMLAGGKASEGHCSQKISP